VTSSWSIFIQLSGSEYLAYNKKEGKPTGLVTLHKNYLLKNVIEGTIEGRIKITES